MLHKIFQNQIVDNQKRDPYRSLLISTYKQLTISQFFEVGLVNDFLIVIDITR
jgi:hypothetical protein